MSPATLLLTATVQPADVIYCDRADVALRLADYLHAFRFWLGEPLVRRIVFVENSGFDLRPFREMAGRPAFKDKEVEILGFRQAPFDRNLGKSYGEALIIQHALSHSRLLGDDGYVIKGTGRYVPTNFYKVWPNVACEPAAYVVANFYAYPNEADSRFFACYKEFLSRYLVPVTPDINDGGGFYFEHALAKAIGNAVRDGHIWSAWPGGGLFVDGVQGSTNTSYPYPRWKRYLYRAIATVRNGAPFRWRLGAPVARPGQGSRT